MKDIPHSWRDPTGWRPTPLQMSVPPEMRGQKYEEWLQKQPLCDASAVAGWIASHGVNAPKPVKPMKPRR